MHIILSLDEYPKLHVQSWFEQVELIMSQSTVLLHISPILSDKKVMIIIFNQ